MMGTETNVPSFLLFYLLHDIVKLNNLLLGMETQFQSNCLSYGSSQAVKLNNPPMGAA